MSEKKHCKNPIVPKRTECGLAIGADVIIDEWSPTCQDCRERSVRRGIDAYFRRHGLDQKYPPL